MHYFLKTLICVMALSTAVRSNSAELVSDAHYVNMGSSFAAGSGIEPHKASSGQCRRSEKNYASLLAEKLDLELDDRSCAGAKSTYLLESWGELPPQIDAVNESTKLVTITVGGNDLNYVSNLFAASCSKEEGLVVEGKRLSCPLWQMPDEEAFARVKRNLHEAIQQISITAPKAKVYLIQYVSLIPEKICKEIPLTELEAGQSRDLAQRLAALTAAVARETRAEVVSVDEVSMSHTACDVDPWSIGVSPTADNAQGMPWHPNSRANEIIANLLLEQLR